MNLKDILKDSRAAIVKKWLESVLRTYHEDAQGPLRRLDARFANPVGYNLSQGIEGLYDSLLRGVMPDETHTFLDGMVRIRAVQDFTPSQAVAFIFSLKKIVRDEAGTEALKDMAVFEELTAMDSAIDDLALFAFDIYMRCREKIYDIKAKEARNMTFRLLQKAQLIGENLE